MLGIIRFFLATCVILFHLSGKFPNFGLYAVNCFYVISGYLITMILNTTYNFKLIPFTTNRFLRLFPSYWLACITGIICIYFIDNPKDFHLSYGLHISVKEFLANLLLIPWAFLSDKIIISPFYAFATPEFLDFKGYMFRAVTSSWSVAVEITCYFLLWCFVARGYKRTLLAILASSIYHWYAISVSDNIITTYSPFLAAMLPFSIGALGYFLSHSIEKKNKDLIKPTRYQIFSLFLFSFLFITNWYIGWQRNEAFASFHYYFNNIIAFGAVVALHGTKLSGKISKLAKFLGDLSYPIFLCHFFIGLVVWQISGQPTENRGWIIFFIGYGLSVIWGLLSILLIDRPISKIRDLIRARANL
ncbi:Acyltransferase family protein [Sodalis glossinidius str. 'morsitans']|uniref:Acyltransferase family protein n=1 Tax=Sodalis glossinidius (strain morsitans) TaxID=343509 RepID=Q2NTQ3_SODGM|nr:acyltransferase [Sodalis glossinidius]BAE74472.1 hypothetical protein SG1197 [Sodalis glossinidius str. 'morsitans']CRL45169.1 Acyltransferase family protein [Sodalis glossinidius str. 'morsitans']